MIERYAEKSLEMCYLSNSATQFHLMEAHPFTEDMSKPQTTQQAFISVKLVKDILDVLLI